MSRSDERGSRAQWFADHSQHGGLSRGEVGVEMESVQKIFHNAGMNFNRNNTSSNSDESASNRRSASSDEPFRSKKAKLVDKLMRDATPYNRCRQEHTNIRATLDQIRADIVSHHDNITKTKKESYLASREREMYDRQFVLLRKDFTDNMNTLIAIRERFDAIVREYQEQLGTSHRDPDPAAAHSEDVGALSSQVKSLEVQKDEFSTVNTRMRQDIEHLQQLLQSCTAVAFDKDGNPVLPHCSIFKALSDDFVGLVKEKTEAKVAEEAQASQDTTGAGAGVGKRKADAMSADVDAGVDGDIKAENTTDNDDASESKKTIDSHHKDVVKTLVQQHRVTDITGIFNPAVYFQNLRKQADEIIDLQRECTSQAQSAQEAVELNNLYTSRLKDLETQLSEVLMQLDAINTETIVKDTTTTVHTLQMQALQEQSVLLKTTLKQLEILKVLDEKKYQRLLDVLKSSDDRANVSEQAVVSLMERLVVLQQDNEKVQEELDQVTDDRNCLAEILVIENDSKVDDVEVLEAEAAKAEQALLSTDAVELRNALRRVLVSNNMLKEEIEKAKGVKEEK